MSNPVSSGPISAHRVVSSLATDAFVVKQGATDAPADALSLQVVGAQAAIDDAVAPLRAHSFDMDTFKPQVFSAALNQQASAGMLVEARAKQVANRLPDNSCVLTEEIKQDAHESMHLATEYLSAMAPPNLSRSFSSSYSSSGSSMVSDKEILNQVGNMMVAVKEDYQLVYAAATDTYAKFYKDFTTTITKLSTYYSSPDTGKTKVEFKKMLMDLFPLMDRHFNTPLVLANDREQAKYWAIELGFAAEKEFAGGALPSYVRQDSSGQWGVYIDMKPLRDIIDSCITKMTNHPSNFNNIFSAIGTPGFQAALMNSSVIWGDVAPTLSDPTFQAWQTGYSTQKETMQNGVQTLAEKFGRANSIYDNLVKVLSSMTSALQETANNALKF